MNWKIILKEWRITLVIVLVALSVILILPSSKQGVIVKSISSDSPLAGKVNTGEYITWVNEKNIDSPNDIYAFENTNFTGVFRFIHSGKLELAYINNGYLGITVDKPPSSNIQFGLDLVGGTRVILKPNGNVTDAIMQQITATLETRVNTFGLKEASFKAVRDVSGNNYIEIEMAGGSREEIDSLLAKQGVFEGKVDRLVTLSNNTGDLLLNGNRYPLMLDNGTIMINGSAIKPNDTIKIDNFDVQLVNSTDESATFMITVFTSKDIQSVCLQDQPGICSSRIVKSGNGWEFDFQVFVTQEGAQRFANLTKDMNVVSEPSSTSSYLDGKIYLYIDNKLVTALSISSDLKGQAITTPSITGFRSTREDALKEQLTLKSILQSGSLPVSLSVIRADQISPVLGSEFIRDALIAIAIAEAAAAAILYFRYRNWKILLPNIMWSLFELILTLGVAALIKWTIDLPSIAGIIAAIGSGSNDQVIMIDEILVGGGEEEKKMLTLKQRLKKSFSIILGSSATVIMGVAPMFFVGIGVMRGFAVTTTLGIFIGIVITRPAFSRVVEIILGREESKANEKKETKVEDTTKKL